MQVAEIKEDAVSMASDFSKHGAQAAETSCNAVAEKADALTSAEPFPSHSGAAAYKLSLWRPCKKHVHIIFTSANKLTRAHHSPFTAVRQSLAV